MAEPVDDDFAWMVFPGWTRRGRERARREFAERFRERYEITTLPSGERVATPKDAPTGGPDNPAAPRDRPRR